MEAIESNGTFLIPEANFPKFEAEMAKLNKRSLKLTGDDITYVVFGYEMKEFEKGQAVKCFNVLLTAEAPKLNGWTFLARIDHANKEVGNIVHVVPGQVLDTKYRDAGSVCEHCNVNRFRRDTFVVHNETTQETKQVGRTCLKDFLGHENPEAMAKRAEFLGFAAQLGQVHSYSKPGEGFVLYLNIPTLLEKFAYTARVEGYVSRKMAMANENLETTGGRAFTSKDLPVEEQDVLLAEQALEWAKNLGDDGRELSDYEHNIKTLAVSGYCTLRSVNYVMSIIPAWSRATGNLFAKGQANVPRYVSQFVGAEKDKIEFQGTIGRITVCETQFGSSLRVALKDLTGNEFVWFTGSEVKASEGQSVKVRATVKGHEEFNNVRRTQLTRCKIEIV